MTHPHVRWSVALAVGLLLATATGLLAARAQGDGRDALLTVVYALVTAPCWVALVLVLTSPSGRPEHDEDSVETQWLATAASGAFLDLLIALGLATTATSVLDVAPVPTVVFLGLAMLDVTVRLEVQRRREG